MSLSPQAQGRGVWLDWPHEISNVFLKGIFIFEEERFIIDKYSSIPVLKATY